MFSSRNIKNLSFLICSVFILIFDSSLRIYGEEINSEKCSADKIDDCKIIQDDLYAESTNNATLIDSDDILVFTVATERTDGFERYLFSARQFKIQPTILGLGEEWKGGDNIKKQSGGGWKINLLKKAIQPHKSDEHKIILFTDGYDVMFLAGLDDIIRKFKATKARILFGAEAFCWPDSDLAQQYPTVPKGKRFLNSGLYIGYAPELWKILTREEISNTDDDQLFFTKAYLNEKLREETQFKLDHKSEIFQNLNGVNHNEVHLFEEKPKEGAETYKIKNTAYHTEPLIVHGNGYSKMTLNYLGNYLANSWNSIDGCISCEDGVLNLTDKNPSEMPLVYIALFVEIASPFLEEQLNKIYDLKYPKERIHLFVHNQVKYHIEHVKKFLDEHSSEYLSVKEIKPDDGTTEWVARDLSLDQCLLKKCDIYFSVDSIAHIDNPNTLKMLIEQNRTIVAPLLSRPGKAWSNFWGALTKDGYYARSNDYLEIVHNEKRGLWNVPYIANAYVLNATLLRKYDRNKISYIKDNLDADMAFCAHLRNLDVFLYVSNRITFGHLSNPDTYDTSRTEPDMYQIFDNQHDWEERYISKDYPDNLNPEKKNHQPCPDVYWFPVTTQRFCDSLIHMMESYGKWSDGTNYDNRLEGGYEAVPTRDIHMTQVGFDRHWLEFLDRYVLPLVEHVFIGYFHKPPHSLMNFVVRYRPDEQPFLKPHHDTSTYTINIALNQVGVDYEGGGCRFIRYNCSVVDTKPGWLLMHPGKLTHYHEGLYVTKGTRYIMVSFVDP